MRILAIGDVHGCSRALDTLLAAVNPQPDDLLIFLGDYVDRGPDSAGVIERLLRLRQTHHLVALCGNHDQMLLEARHGIEDDSIWLTCGGWATLASYGKDGEPGLIDDIPASHWDFLEQGLVDWFETDTHFFVHANVYPILPLAEQPAYMLRWEKLSECEPHFSGKVMVCGHTQQRSGQPLHLGHAVCIDTWVYGDGWLTCLDVTTGRIWQANQGGESREAWLDDFRVE